MLFVSDASHQQRAIQLCRPCRKPLSVVEEARVRLLDLKGHDAPIETPQLHAVVMTLGVGCRVARRTQREEANGLGERWKNARARQTLRDVTSDDNFVATVASHDADRHR